VLAGWQEAAQQPILIKRKSILTDKLRNLLKIVEWANRQSATQVYFGKHTGAAYILEVLNLEDPNAYAFAIEKFSSAGAHSVLNSSSNRVAQTGGSY